MDRALFLFITAIKSRDSFIWYHPSPWLWHRAKRRTTWPKTTRDL